MQKHPTTPYAYDDLKKFKIEIKEYDILIPSNLKKYMFSLS